MTDWMSEQSAAGRTRDTTQQWVAPGEGLRAGGESAEAVKSRSASPTEQVTAFAEAIAVPVWKEVEAQLGANTERVRSIKRQLADHTWCDLSAEAAICVARLLLVELARRLHCA